MKAFHYKGKYNGDENSLPQREHPEGYVAFKEANIPYEIKNTNLSISYIYENADTNLVSGAVFKI